MYLVNDTVTREEKVFSLESRRFPCKSPVRDMLSFSIEKILGLHRLEQLYGQVRNFEDPKVFCEKALDILGVRCEVEERDVQNIPAAGPVVVVANHPFGAIEGMAMASILQAVRPDSRIMANYLLARIPQLRKIMIFVNPFLNGSPLPGNIKPLRDSIRWLQQGGLLGVFPAGEVAHLDIGKRSISDPEWKSHVAKIIRRGGAQVVPMFFEGANGPLFQLAGFVHPRLRTAMLPRQLLGARMRPLVVRIGAPILSKDLSSFGSDQEMMRYLRLRTEALSHRKPRRCPGVAVQNTQPEGTVVPVARPGSQAKLVDEVNALPESQVMATGGDLVVYTAHAHQIPLVLREIGRCREISFREAGEGTGGSLDLDEFDRHYMHLFIWDKQASRVAGAYRMGLVDNILRRYGRKGLYTNTLFQYRFSLLRKLSGGIELGRSFVRPEYQREYLPLLLMWKGIGQFVARNHEYRWLFGTVSMSNDYQRYSRSLVVNFLSRNHTSKAWAGHVHAVNPPDHGLLAQAAADIESGVIGDMDSLSRVVGEVEGGSAGVPVLIRNYVKLGGEVLGFNIDKKFNMALDVLMVVDLTRTPMPMLSRYLGVKGAMEFLASHSRAGAAQPAEDTYTNHGKGLWQDGGSIRFFPQFA